MFTRIKYNSLNSRQKENFNFQKVAGELAEYGYNCLRLNDDWQGADFLAIHVNGNTVLKIQLKGRMTIDRKYKDKDICIAFLNGDDCYIYPHDEMLENVLKLGKISASMSWLERGGYSWPNPPKWALDLLQKYKM